jgi:hypothetical protein
MLRRLLATIAFALLLASCTAWTTRYSGVYRDKNLIVVHLDHEGPPMIGFCGVCRRLEASYTFQLTPIQRVYVDSEISLEVHIPRAPAPGSYDLYSTSRPHVRGTLTFDESFSYVDIAIATDETDRFVRFGGNGRYPVRAGE